MRSGGLVVVVPDSVADLESSPRLSVRHLERVTDLDGTAEALYRRRMEIYSWLDNVPAVHSCFEQLEDRLADYGRQPGPATQGSEPGRASGPDRADADRGSGNSAALTKTEAGTRTLPVPTVIVPELRSHLVRFAEPGEDGLIFVGAKGGMLRRTGFHRHWAKALTEVGLTGVRFHDLRHTGSTLAAIAGATLPELKERMGHTSDRAAMIYLHATEERHQEIADVLSAMAKTQFKKPKKNKPKKPSGTERARKGQRKA